MITEGLIIYKLTTDWLYSLQIFQKIYFLFFPFKYQTCTQALFAFIRISIRNTAIYYKLWQKIMADGEWAVKILSFQLSYFP